MNIPPHIFPVPLSSSEPKSKGEFKTLIVIPTYNEIENLPRLVDEIRALDMGLHILVVDDNSPDGTGDWVRGRMEADEDLQLIQRSGKLGLGSAYVIGFKYAISKGYELVFEMDADFSHHPSYLPYFLEHATKYDLVLGSRYIKGVNVINWPMSRLLLSFFANLYARLITGLPVKDATGGFKCFRVSALKELNLDRIKSDGYSFQIEVTYKMWKKGFRIKEIPIIFMDRSAGVSKMSGKIVQEALFLLIRLRLGRG